MPDPSLKNSRRRRRGGSAAPAVPGTLDERLTVAQKTDVLRRVSNGLTSAGAAARLREKYGIEVTSQEVRHWLSERRLARSGDAFDKLLVAIEQDNQRAAALGQRVGAAFRLNEMNVLMLSQVLFEARQSDSPGAMTQAAAAFSKVLAAVAASRKADASVLQAETSGRKARYDAARAALEHAAELQQINSTPAATEHEKIERAVARLFGSDPAPVSPQENDG